MSLLSTIKTVVKSGPIPGALAFFLFLNFMFIFLNPFGSVDPDALPVARNWVWWATHEYNEGKSAPKIVVLGSSVVMHPLWHHEADYRQKPVDLVADHRSYYLESVIRNKVPLADISCFNFGLPGSMVSDDFMVIKALFNDYKKPSAIVLGLCPRDMIDNRFNCAGSSKHYQYLARFTDTSKQLELAMPQWWQRIGYLLTENVYFASKAQAAQVFFQECMQSSFKPFLAKLPASPLDFKSEEDKRFAMYRSQVEKGFWIAVPNAPYAFYSDMADLKKRFKNANDSLFLNQKQWLDMALLECKQKDIRVILVNMPNTPIARSVMPKGVYERHVACLTEAAKKYDCLYVDADLPNFYTDTDFTDWCHLSADGGKKAFRVIGLSIAQDKYSIASLSGKNSVAASKLLKPL